MTIEVRMGKSLFGHKAESYVDLADGGGEKKEGTKRQLRITTSKGSTGRLTTYISACSVGDGFIQTAVFRDFHKQAIRSLDRCTVKNVEAQHRRVLEDIDALVAEAIAYEKAKQEEGG